MKKHLIDFDNISWIEAGEGVRYKVFKSGMQQIRLVEFFEGFVEKDWCIKGHAGYVLEGSCSIDFNGSIEVLEVGNSFFIPNGEEDKHKVIIKKGERILVILYEIIGDSAAII